MYISTAFHSRKHFISYARLELSYACEELFATGDTRWTTSILVPNHEDVLLTGRHIQLSK
ncbi:hypothetical protein KIN20_027021 [Parelaphostrongylus tenuis]|uniref:Uncharacterized protein n=1 Tax=Parelaphostrongylus tenuis TaxID=148309 RepID=A0AAD5WDD1_PARTN|nr:hypothetical protein KIN20_027021 [Parelaphostrongylus tenuis]